MLREQFGRQVEVALLRPPRRVQQAARESAAGPLEQRLEMAKLVGLRKYTNITLKRGYTQDKSLWAWYANIHNGLADRRNVTIVLMNEEHRPVLRWHAENAWINKIEGPSFKASGNEVAIESVELVHEGLTIEM